MWTRLHMISERVLVVEDDASSMRVIVDSFAMKGYTVEVAVDGEDGLEKALNLRPDLIVLDVMLPRMNGFEICRVIRDEGLDVPILMLTANRSEADVVRGLNLGADDYLTKPFRVHELLARANALLRRRRREEADVRRFGPFVLDLSAWRLWKGTREVILTPKELGVLVFLIKRSGRTVTREGIVRHVWGHAADVTDRSVDRCITTLRRKIEPDPQEPTYIKAIRGIGYRFEPGGADVEG
jgi:DNA-binding response OmpR family regulator